MQFITIATTTTATTITIVFLLIIQQLNGFSLHCNPLKSIKNIDKLHKSSVSTIKMNIQQSEEAAAFFLTDKNLRYMHAFHIGDTYTSMQFLMDKNLR